MSLIRIARTLAVALALFSLAAAGESKALSQGAIENRKVSDGIIYREYEARAPSGVVALHMVLIKQDAIRAGRLQIEPAMGGDRAGDSSTPARMGSGSGCLAAINGPYFTSSAGMDYPLGFAAREGKFMRLGNLFRPMVGIDSNGELKIEVAKPSAFVTSDSIFKPLFLWDINTLAGDEAVTLYDRHWGPTVSPQSGVAISIAPYKAKKSKVIVIGPEGPPRSDWDGVVVSLSDKEPVRIPDGGYGLVLKGASIQHKNRYGIGAKILIYTYELPSGWEKMRWIATLGPWFVHEGRMRDYSNETRYRGGILGRANRSFIGTTWNDEIIFGVTCGAAVNVEDLADLLVNSNVRDAVMCDSGSSSGLWVKETCSIGGSRPVPLGFVVRKAGKPQSDPRPFKVWSEKIHAR